MLFTLYCTFAPDAVNRVKDLRLEHYAFLREVKPLIVEGGPLLGPDHVPTGMLIVVNMDNEQAAYDFIAKEPYNAHGFFKSVVVRQWSHVIPEVTPGYVESEYQKEFYSRKMATM